MSARVCVCVCVCAHCDSIVGEDIDIVYSVVTLNTDVYKCSYIHCYLLHN